MTGKACGVGQLSRPEHILVEPEVLGWGGVGCRLGGSPFNFSRVMLFMSLLESWLVGMKEGSRTIVGSSLVKMVWRLEVD